MNCIDENIGRLIFRYELDLLTKDEKRSFENHLLNCDACYQDLYSMQPVVEVLKAHKSEIAKALVNRRNLSLTRSAPKPSTVINNILSLRPHPFLRLSAAFALVVLLLIVVVPTPQSYRSMAAFQPAEYRSFALRGGPDLQWFTLFDQGMQLYNQGEFQRAIDALSQAHQINPQHEAIPFYLGVSFLLTRQVDSSIVYLRKIASDTTSHFNQSAHWYLANAYLFREDPAQAMQHLQRLASTSNRYQNDAAELLRKISARRDTFIIVRWLQHAKLALNGALK